MMPLVPRFRATVRGRVQGVSFRAHTERQAQRRGVTGWVKNQRDGSVLVEAQGSTASLEGLLGWLAQGPSGAHVAGFDVEWVEDLKDEVGFEIRY
jgi:acylphosphatase